jgi:hypothetical protein
LRLDDGAISCNNQLNSTSLRSVVLDIRSLSND